MPLRKPQLFKRDGTRQRVLAIPSWSGGRLPHTLAPSGGTRVRGLRLYFSGPGRERETLPQGRSRQRTGTVCVFTASIKKID
jgi:hypothetical protein